MARMLQLSAVTVMNWIRGGVMIAATLRIDLAEDTREDVNRLLRSLIEPTRDEPGCISCRLYHETNSPTAITWVEEWRGEEDLKRHLRKAQYRKIQAALDMYNVQSEIRFDTVIETAGMQLIAEARGVKIGK